MPYIEKIAVEKARKINSTPSIYGTFAEIGAGQEVVNHFFKAGKASQTVAKSMSAYDMTFSDQIYGRAGRYVSEKRLFKMLDHEYELLQKRLAKIRGHNTKFFAFADTVAASTANRSGASHHHGWMGIRFQSEYKKPYNEIILHVNLLDKTRLQQYETLGVLGVNLIYSAFYGKKDHKNIIQSLLDNFESSRVDINVLSCSGKVFKKLNHHQLNRELIRQKSTEALLFQKNDSPILPSSALYEKHILLQQYSPARSRTPTLIPQALSYIRNTKKIKRDLVSLINIPLQYLKTENVSHFLKKHHIPTHTGNIKGDELFFPAKEKGLNQLTSKSENLKIQQYVLVSDFKKLHALKNFIRKATDQYIFIVLNTDTFRKILKNYRTSSSDDNILEFFSRLCDSKTILMIPDYAHLAPSSAFYHIEKHLLHTKQIIHLR